MIVHAYVGFKVIIVSTFSYFVNNFIANRYLRFYEV